MPTSLLTHVKQIWNRFWPRRWANGLLVAILLLLVALPVAAQAPSPYPGSAGYMPELTPDVETPVQLLDSADAKLQVYLPVLNNRRPECTLDPNPNFFGVQVYGTFDRRHPYYPWLETSGADWIRTLVPWTDVEPTNTTPAQYDWNLVDQILAPAVAGCYYIIATHAVSPRWAAPFPLSQNGPFMRTSLPDLVEYLAAMVERYDGDGSQDAPGSPVVNYWELYNEPDASSRFVGTGGWGEYGQTGGTNPATVSYAEMLAAVVPAMRQANPNVKILLGGLAYCDFTGESPTGGTFVRSFLDDVLAAGGGAYFDYMNFHSYAEMDLWRPPGVIVRVAELRAILAKHGLTKPFVITETGWYSDSTPERSSSPEIQARYITELYTQGKAANIQTLINFTLADLNEYIHDTGLVTSAYVGNPIVPKPALPAFQTALSMLEHAEFVGNVPSASTIEAYEFADGTAFRTVYVAWLYPVYSTGNESLTLPVHAADLYDIYGNFLGTRTASDGTLTLEVTAQPVYIIENSRQEANP